MGLELELGLELSHVDRMVSSEVQVMCALARVRLGGYP